MNYTKFNFAEWQIFRIHSAKCRQRWLAVPFCHYHCSRPIHTKLKCNSSTMMITFKYLNFLFALSRCFLRHSLQSLYCEKFIYFANNSLAIWCCVTCVLPRSIWPMALEKQKKNACSVYLNLFFHDDNKMTKAKMQRKSCALFHCQYFSHSSLYALHCFSLIFHSFLSIIVLHGVSNELI